MSELAVKPDENLRPSARSFIRDRWPFPGISLVECNFSSYVICNVLESSGVANDRMVTVQYKVVNVQAHEFDGVCDLPAFR